MTGVEMIKLLKQNGFEHTKTRGSHYHLMKNGIIVIVPHHHTEMGKGLTNKILKAAGFVTRDARSKERKKPGLKAARRAPQFSKR